MTWINIVVLNQNKSPWFELICNPCPFVSLLKSVEVFCYWWFPEVYFHLHLCDTLLFMLVVFDAGGEIMLFPINKWPHLRTKYSSMSSVIWSRGLEFEQASIWWVRVVSSSYISFHSPTTLRKWRFVDLTPAFYRNQMPLSTISRHRILNIWMKNYPCNFLF